MAVLSRVRRGLPALAILLLAGSPGLASAEAVEARYVAALGGIAIMEIDLLLDLGQGGYRIRTRLRTRGVGTLFGQGEQVTEAEGTFRGIEPAPARYRTEGAWRGTFRQIVLAYPPGTAPPVLQRLEPPEAWLCY
ncbi:hypothetical protein [Roseicella frigidaeris]|uniref:DUF3108 domain-containing protein n=1 Tax=Roseicella frigidaeris TaxID=2230885 RepID=A0A327M687_9PROT|nr:hypothetical protein [Roseicella frigidaeris]RAI57812.1 hypothetical protein DOO78_17520 [Roseicella frigidaeris]